MPKKKAPTMGWVLKAAPAPKPKARVAKKTIPAPAEPATRLFQFKLTIDGLDPPIWRRVVVPDCRLSDLHWWIQMAFSWTNSHLHCFTIAGKRYEEPSPYDDFGLEALDELDFTLGQLLPPGSRKAKWQYEYDFGDSWLHTIQFEKFVTPEPGKKYPLCLEGEFNGPPDDCGGPWGFPDYVKIVTNPKHPDYREMIEWGGKFDPNAFDAAKTTTRMRRR